MSKPRVVGVDGCKGGWLAVSINGTSLDAQVFGQFADMHRQHRGALILVDIPIGLPSAENPSRRACDLEARRILSSRASSVFPAPARETLHSRSFVEACETNVGILGVKISRQAWGIVPKIREVDEYLRQATGRDALIREVHPEVCFWALNGRQVLSNSKKESDGRRERTSVLTRWLPAASSFIEAWLRRFPRREVAHDDLLDASAAALTGLATGGVLQTIPAKPVHDGAGLPMEMVYRDVAPGERAKP